MMDNIEKENLMVTEYINGILDKYMMVNGEIDLNMGMELGKDLKGINIQDNGNLVNEMDMEFISGVMVINIKANGKMVLSMDLERNFIFKEIYIRVNINLENLEDKVNIFGAINQFILEVLIIE